MKYRIKIAFDGDMYTPPGMFSKYGIKSPLSQKYYASIKRLWYDTSRPRSLYSYIKAERCGVGVTYDQNTQ